MAHTPGPWRVAGHPGDGSGTDWRQIVTDALPFSPSYIGQALKDDATLIAAAPDLLDACEAALQDFEDEPDKIESTWARINELQAAIAKAKGGQP